MRESGLQETLESFFDYKTGSLYTAINCRVVGIKMELEDTRIDVQPLPRAFKNDGESKDRPVITNVPLIFPSSSQAAITFPVDVGDTVLCVFSQRSLDQFKSSSNNATYTPRDRRRFSIRDAVAIPGLFAFNQSINDPSKRTWSHSTRDTVVVNNIGTGQENELRLKEGGNIEVKTNQDFYATFADGVIECNNLTINCSGNMTVVAGNEIDLTATTINMIASSMITAQAPVTNWSGAFNLSGPFSQSGGSGATATFNVPIVSNESVTVNGADVVANGVSLTNHTHTDSTGGSTGSPN